MIDGGGRGGVDVEDLLRDELLPDFLDLFRGSAEEDVASFRSKRGHDEVRRAVRRWRVILVVWIRFDG